MNRKTMAAQLGLTPQELDEEHHRKAEGFGLTDAEMEIFIHIEATRFALEGRIVPIPDRKAIDTVKVAINCCRDGCADMGVMMRSDGIEDGFFGFATAEEVCRKVMLWPIPEYMLLNGV